MSNTSDQPQHPTYLATCLSLRSTQTKPGKPNSSSADMLYSAFLDEDVHSQLMEYDALATIPSWDKDTTTADDFSVDVLYDMAFPRHAPDDKFWVMTLSLGGDPGKLRGGLGQSSGGGESASIYNNDDQEFVRFVRATSELERQHNQRWGTSTSSRSLDEALLVSLKDPRYEERAPLFVTAGMVSAPLERMG